MSIQTDRQAAAEQAAQMERVDKLITARAEYAKELLKLPAGYVPVAAKNAAEKIIIHYLDGMVFAQPQDVVGGGPPKQLDAEQPDEDDYGLAGGGDQE